MPISLASLYNSESAVMRLDREIAGSAQDLKGKLLPDLARWKGAWLGKTLQEVGPTLSGWLALCGVAASTWLSFCFGGSFAFTGFLHLILVVLAAMYGGFWQATVVSVVAFFCLNYFFVPPLFSLVNSPANWVALGAFEFTALVISRLSLHAQAKAREAVAGRRDMERLYETSRRILLLDRAGEPGSLIPGLIRETFDLQTVSLFDALPAAAFQSGLASGESEQRTRDAYCLGADSFDAHTNSWYCVVRVGTRPVGGLGLNGTAMTSLAATALASLTGIALERARAAQRESRAEAAHQTEQLRTAVLDALAHEFRTPLTVVRSASSGLLAVGGLSEFQADLLTVIDRQAATLDHLTQRLLTAARLDTVQFTPRREPLRFSDLMRDAIGDLEQEAARSRFQIIAPHRETAILADRELILTSLAQLLDNTLKYSEPASPVQVFIKGHETRTVLTIRSKGTVITAQDCERIFDRFYRGRQTQHVSAGTGLGLSIVKKIVHAHQGSVWAEPEAGYGTSFSISLPSAEAR
jgi:two-component system sensor histidine kinase KdpD